MSRLARFFSINQRVTGGPVLLLLGLSLVLGVDRYMKEYDQAIEHTIEIAKVSAQPLLNLMKSAVGGGNYAIVEDDEALRLYKANKKLLFFLVEGKTDKKRAPFSIVYDAKRGKVYRTEPQVDAEKALKEKIDSAEGRLKSMPADHPNRPRIAKLLEKFKSKLADIRNQRREVARIIKEYPLPTMTGEENGVRLDTGKWLLYMTLPTGNPGGGVMKMVMDASDISRLGRSTFLSVIPVNLTTLIIGMLLAWAISRTIVKPINVMQSTIMEIEKDSDLTRRINLHSSDELGKTAAAFNKMLEKFQSIIGEVAGSTEKIALTAGRTAEVADRSAAGAIAQKSDTEHLASAITEMTATVKEVASGTAQAEQAARKADSEANKGKEVVVETIESITNLAGEVNNVAETINRLERDSKDVGMIIDVINDIAFQINLLALNASVEAARAGRHGKGFSVVAEEVRNLAGRTQKSTKQISEIVEKLQKEAEAAMSVTTRSSEQAQNSVQRAKAAGESLESITKAVSAITEMNIQIANAAEEQNAVANEISKNVDAISKVADDNATGAESVLKESEQLAELTAKLQSLLAQFKISKTAGKSLLPPQE